MTRRRVHAFTLIELLVVIGIIGLLMAILFPALRKARIAALRVQCASNMRVIGQAIIAYSNQHNGRAPTKGAHKEYPYEWNKVSIVNPLMRYGLTLRVLSCPSQELFNPPYDQWVGHMSPDDYLVNYMYLVGLADSETLAGGFNGKWYEKVPTAAPFKLAKKPVRIMLTDMNLYYAAGDNGFDVYGPVPNVRWFYSNHATRNGFDPTRQDVKTFVKGSNRLYSDGHVEWVLPAQMGREDRPISIQIDSARYSHQDDSRPYYW